MNLSNDQIKSGIISKDRHVLKHVYEVFLPMVRKMVIRNNGQPEQAMDVFQDGLVVMFEKLCKMDDHDRIIFGAYFQSVCKYIWLKKLKEVSTKDMDIAERFVGSEDSLEETEADVVASEKYELYREYFNRLGEDCKKILNLFFAKTALKDIAVQMGFSDSYAKKKKHVCQKGLIESIESDRRFNKLRGE